ncbi:MAG: tetratricopeptide repeat protein [Myxococcales bacterium]
MAFIDKDYALALRAAQGAVRCRPDCFHGQILLGDVLCTQGMEVAALKAYHQARRLAPDRSEPYWAISTIHLLAGRWRDSLRYLDLAKQRLKRGDGPLYEWIAEDRAISLLKLGRIEEALESVRWGLKRRPKQARLLELRAALKLRGRPRLQLVVDRTRGDFRAR